MEHISGSFAFDRFTDAIILSLDQKEIVINKTKFDNRSLQRLRISGSVKLHIGDSWGKLKTLVQFQHSRLIITFLN